MLALYSDVSGEGALRPWRGAGGIMDQPAREVYAMRVIRAAWADCRERDRSKKK